MNIFHISILENLTAKLELRWLKTETTRSSELVDTIYSEIEVTQTVTPELGWSVEIFFDRTE